MVARGELTCSSTCSSPLRNCWKMLLTREVESLVARCQRATAHDMTIQSAVVTLVQVSFMYVQRKREDGRYDGRPFHVGHLGSLRLVSLLTLLLLDPDHQHAEMSRSRSRLLAITRVAPSSKVAIHHSTRARVKPLQATSPSPLPPPSHLHPRRRRLLHHALHPDRLNCRRCRRRPPPPPSPPSIHPPLNQLSTA